MATRIAEILQFNKYLLLDCAIFLNILLNIPVKKINSKFVCQIT